MPWTPDRYPASMRGLPPEPRLKAIKLANALLEQGFDDGKVIRIGIASARQWVSHATASGPAMGRS